MAISFDIEKNLVSVNDGSSDWNLELNLISWNGKPAKYDLRKWSDDHEKMGKGVTMTEDEVIQLFQNAGDVLSALGADGVPDLDTPIDADDSIEKLPFD